MKKSARLKVLRAMEILARSVNDETVFEEWLIDGIADGDIDGSEDDEDLEYYLDDSTFSTLMETFLHVMARAKKSGGLYVDGIVSMEYDKAQKRYNS